MSHQPAHQPVPGTAVGPLLGVRIDLRDELFRIAGRSRRHGVVVIGTTDKQVQAVVSVGGFLGIGDKEMFVASDPSALRKLLSCSTSPAARGAAELPRGSSISIETPRFQEIAQEGLIPSSVTSSST